MAKSLILILKIIKEYLYIYYIYQNIREVYDNPATTTKRANILAFRAGVLLEDAQKFLKHEQIAQTSKQFVKPKDLNHYSPTGAKKYHWQSDVLFFNDFQGVDDKRIAGYTDSVKYYNSIGLCKTFAWS